MHGFPKLCLAAKRVPTGRRWIVRDSGGTVVFSGLSNVDGRSIKTVEFAKEHNKPCLHINAGVTDPRRKLRELVADNGIRTLNVAAPRASGEPEVGDSGWFAFAIEKFDLLIYLLSEPA